MAVRGVGVRVRPEPAFVATEEALAERRELAWVLSGRRQIGHALPVAEARVEARGEQAPRPHQPRSRRRGVKILPKAKRVALQVTAEINQVGPSFRDFAGEPAVLVR